MKLIKRGLLVSLVLALSSCAVLSKLKSASSASEAERVKAIVGREVALTFISGSGADLDVIKAYVQSIEPVPYKNMTTVNFRLRNHHALKAKQIESFFERNQGHLVKIKQGDHVLTVRLMVKLPLEDNTFKMNLKNSNDYALRFIDSLLEQHYDNKKSS